jgi:hypothetical protein
MLRLNTFTNCGVMALLLASVACEKSVNEERNEAVNAQREADETAQAAANQRGKEVAQANKEAAKEIGEARREAHEDSLKAVENEIEKTSGAQANANEEAKEAVDATREARVDLKKSTDARLKKIDERSRALHQKVDGAGAKVSADVKSALGDLDRQSASVRSDVQRLDTTPAQPLTEARTRIERSLDALEKGLDNLEDKL